MSRTLHLVLGFAVSTSVLFRAVSDETEDRPYDMAPIWSIALKKAAGCLPTTTADILIKSLFVQQFSTERHRHVDAYLFLAAAPYSTLHISHLALDRSVSWEQR